MQTIISNEMQSKIQDQLSYIYSSIFHNKYSVLPSDLAITVQLMSTIMNDDITVASKSTASRIHSGYSTSTEHLV